MNPNDYLGEMTLKKMRDTKWFILARVLAQMLYDGHVVSTEYVGDGSQIVNKPKDGERYDKAFLVSNRIYVGETPPWIKVDGRDGNYFEVEKALRVLMHECERMAMREVCP